MTARPDELALRVEAILFAAGKPLGAKEIADALSETDPRAVARAIRTLEAAYSGRSSSLEVRRVADRYALQLREEFVPAVHSVTPVEMAPRTVKALTLIAYHQPVLQSVLVRMIGEVAYEEVQHLRGLGLVHTEARGATLELTTTRRFAEYFGIEGGRPEAIRKYLEQKLGVPPAANPEAITGPPAAKPAAPARPPEPTGPPPGALLDPPAPPTDPAGAPVAPD
jgi:segregation and condensation protein B